MSTHHTDRRSFLKTGALVATPVIAMAPGTALAADPSADRLARLEDEREVERLTRAFLRRFNGRGADECGEFLARSGAIRLDPATCGIEEDSAADAALEMDGANARLSRRCVALMRRDFEGDSTIEQMARLQGQSAHSWREPATLKAEFTKSEGRWTIASLHLA